MTPTAKRPWLRFSLWTLFVVVTLFACGLCYQINWIRQRHALLEQLAEQRLVFSSPYMHRKPSYRTAPFPLWLLGEEGAGRVDLYLSESDAKTNSGDNQIERARRLFPESQIYATEMP
jgi:hypothetical protein